MCIDLTDSNLEISVVRDSEGYGIFSPEKISIPIDFDIVYELKNANVYGSATSTGKKARISVATCKKVKAFGFLGKGEYIFTWRGE